MQLGSGGQPKTKGKAGVAEDKDHRKHAEELQSFIQKRIKLFEEYKQREDQSVRPLLGLSPTTPWHLTGNLGKFCIKLLLTGTVVTLIGELGLVT